MPHFTIKSLPEIVFARPFSATKHKFTNRKYFLTEIIYVTEGCLEISFGDHVYRVGVGNCLIIPYGSLVNCQIADGYSCNSHLGLAFIADLVIADHSDESNLLKFPAFEVSLLSQIENRAAFEQAFTQLITEYSQNNIIEATSLLFHLLGQISAQPSSGPRTTPINEVYTRKMVSYIESNFDRKISISEIAKTVLITPEYASNVFKTTLGESILSYVNRVKIHHAKLLLKNTEMSLAEVATSIGIVDNIAYFSRFFKKNVGIPPSEYKRIIQRQDIDVKQPPRQQF